MTVCSKFECDSAQNFSLLAKAYNCSLITCILQFLHLCWLEQFHHRIFAFRALRCKPIVDANCRLFIWNISASFETFLCGVAIILYFYKFWIIRHNCQTIFGIYVHCKLIGVIVGNHLTFCFLLHVFANANCRTKRSNIANLFWFFTMTLWVEDSHDSLCS